MTKSRGPDHAAALRGERREMLRFCAGLSEADWLTPSFATGWRVKDVVAHLGGGCHALFTPAALTLLRSSDIERTNDAMVDARRDWTPQAVCDEFARWSARATRLASIVTATPLAPLRVPLAELGTFPLRLLLGGALVFDQHTHLRFDMAPALDLVAPGTDANRMAVVIEWMLAVLANQLRSNPLQWMDRPLTLVLTGPGGGCWSVTSDGAIAARPGDHSAGATIIGVAVQFPAWATGRAPWRERTVTVDGDAEYGARFLDSVNVV